MKTNIQQSGRSMIEMLGVLAIIGVLSVGGIMGYSKAMMRHKINKTIEEITMVAGNIRMLYSGQPDKYKGLSTSPSTSHIVTYSYGADIWSDASSAAILVKAHAIPDEMLNTKYFDYYRATEGLYNVGSNETPFHSPFGGFSIGSTKSNWGISDSKYDRFTIYLDSLPIEACIELATHDWKDLEVVSMSVSDGKYSTKDGSTLSLDYATSWCTDHVTLTFK